MDDLAGMQEKFDALDKLLQALLPFVSPLAREQLKRLRQFLAPFLQLQEMMEMLEMLEVMNAMQDLNSVFGSHEDPEGGQET